MPEKIFNKRLVVPILLFSILLNGFGIDVYSPSLPIVKHYFNTSTELTQLTIGAYLLGFALIQLVIGVVCDNLGRRKPFLYSLCIYIVVTLFITQVHDIYLLLALRFIQGLATGCFIVAARAIIVDSFQGKELQKISNTVSISWAIGPIIAPIIGSYLQHYFEWQACFYFLAIYGVLCLIPFYFSVPETLLVKKAFNFDNIIDSYKRVLNHGEFWLCTLILGSVFSILVLFNVMAPFLIEVVMGYSVVTYGYVALIMGLMWFFGTLSNKYSHEINKAIKTKISFSVLVITASVLVFLSTQFFNIYTIVIPLGIIFYLGGFIFSIYFAHNMSILPSEIAATAGAFMGATVVTMGSVFGSFLGSQLKSNTALPLTLLILLLVIASAFLSYFERKKLKSL